MTAIYNEGNKEFHLNGKPVVGKKSFVVCPGPGRLPTSSEGEGGIRLYKTQTNVTSVKVKKALKFTIYLVALAVVGAGLAAILGHPLGPVALLIGLIVKKGCCAVAAKSIVYGIPLIIAAIAKKFGLGNQVIKEVNNDPVPVDAAAAVDAAAVDAATVDAATAAATAATATVFAAAAAVLRNAAADGADGAGADGATAAVFAAVADLLDGANGDAEIEL